MVKVGIINCDLHAFYYGALMFKHDPIILRELNQSAFFYFYLQYNDPKKITVSTVSGFQLSRVWNEDRSQAERMVKLFGKQAKVCTTFEEVSDNVDLVFIADCTGDGSDHLKLATPSIKKGIPTFIDKPFAYEVKDARKMVEMAKEHKTPVMSLSMLRVLPHAMRFKNRFAELENPQFGIIKGGGDTLAGQIHTISLAQHLFGSGVESVEAMGKTPLGYIHLDYGGKPDKPKFSVMLCCDSGPTYHCSFYASAYSEQGAIHSPNLGDFEFPFAAAEVLKMIKKMVKTRKPQVSYAEMVECIAIAAAARLSQKEHRRVSLNEV